MEILISYERNIPVLKLSGRFDGFGASQFDAVCNTIESAEKFWVLDFTEVQYLSSAGVRSLLKAERSLRAASGGIVIAGVSAFVKQVLQMAGMFPGFRSAGSLSEALSLVRNLSPGSEKITEYQLQDRNYRFTVLGHGPAKLETWGEPHAEVLPQYLVKASLADLGFVIGNGGFGHDRNQAAENVGALIGFGRFAGAIERQPDAVADFLFTPRPSDTFVYVSSAVSISGEPSFMVELKLREKSTLLNIVREIVSLLSEKDGIQSPVAFLIAFNDSCAGIGLAGPVSILQDLQLSAAFGKNESSEFGGEYFVAGRFVILTGWDPTSLRAPEDLFASGIDLENLQNVGELQPELEIEKATFWLYPCETIEAGESRLLTIEIEEGDLQEEWDSIIRRIYVDCSRVVLQPLHGGFMSKTFRVRSYDKEGRKQLPTVLKIGSLEVTQREEQAARNYVEKFILNNSTTIMGSATEGTFAGLRYNFLGINGADSKLTWLREHYTSRPFEELRPIFQKIYSRILAPWYGQPKNEPVRLYEQHDPQRLFPKILSDCHQEMGIAPDIPVWWSEFLRRELPNPFYFLKTEYPKRKNRITPCYTSITHGDLNMQNVLLDEQENIYIIDFSETRPRNIVSDFARLEPIVKFETTALESEAQLKQLLEFESGLWSIERLSDSPPFEYNGSDPFVKKAHETVCLLRDFAAKFSEGELLPYLLAVLEWTFPVVSYYGFPAIRKMYAVHSAALICEKFLQDQK